MELDYRELKRLKELVPYKVLAPTPDEICNEIEEKNKQLDKYKNVIDKIKEKVDYYKSAKYGTYDSDDILADLNYIFLELLEEVE